jgi:CBS domain-containing protein
MPRVPTPTAADIMTPSPRTCSPFSTVLEAVMIFRDADCGAVPIVEEGRPTGILTDRDVALALPDHEHDLAGLPVRDIMTQGVVTVAPGTPLDQVVEKFGDHAVRRLLVVDGDRLQGIIAWADVAPHTPDQTLGRTVTEVVEAP